MALTDIYKNFRIGKLSALILAGGSGTRMGSEIPKQHIQIHSIPVIVHTLLVFEKTACVHEIIVAIRPGEENLYEEYKQKYAITKLKKTVIGGSTRSESAFHAMEAADPDCDYIAVHDGARCLVTPRIIETVAFEAVRHKAATAACPVTDTVVIINSVGMTETDGQPARSSLMALQTPQIFDANLYRAISYTAQQDGFSGTDDTSLAHHCGFACKAVNTGSTNIKITTKEDILRAEILLSGKEDNV
ncbi:MAG: 2-C-methyl-D-erythritol 4-phosphate cytidylyltransferase [Ruminococcaceae bacterium]|nr:2-C-methyl-D-erythritol 4-phosphate cytidylyltransferase [Oscillospiraceae bacterium]